MMMYEYYLKGMKFNASDADI